MEVVREGCTNVELGVPGNPCVQDACIDCCPCTELSGGVSVEHVGWC